MKLKLRRNRPPPAPTPYEQAHWQAMTLTGTWRDSSPGDHGFRELLLDDLAVAYSMMADSCTGEDLAVLFTGMGATWPQVFTDSAAISAGLARWQYACRGQAPLHLTGLLDRIPGYLQPEIGEAWDELWTGVTCPAREIVLLTRLHELTREHAGTIAASLLEDAAAIIRSDREGAADAP